KPLVNQEWSERRAGKPGPLLFGYGDLGRERVQVLDGFRGVRALGVEVLAAAEADSDLAVEHANVVVHRIHDVAGEEDRNRRRAAGEEQAAHLGDRREGDLAASERILLGGVGGAANSRHVVLRIDHDERWALPDPRPLRPLSALQDRAVFGRQNLVPRRRHGLVLHYVPATVSRPSPPRPIAVARNSATRLGSRSTKASSGCSPHEGPGPKETPAPRGPRRRRA